MRPTLTLLTLGIAALLFACKKETPAVDPPVFIDPSVTFVFRFDTTQARLDNLGQPSTLPAGNAGQNPHFNGMAAHYVELTESPNTPVGQGLVLYKGEETTVGGSNAIKFSGLTIAKEGVAFLTVPYSLLKAGTYRYARVSLAYQNYDIDLWANGLKVTGTLASFVGFNNYIESVKVRDKVLAVNGNRKQGFWAFETTFGLDSARAPGTTVPNPLAATSPIPAGSCLVTGSFETPWTPNLPNPAYTTIEISVSTNKSFEWRDSIANGRWEPTLGEKVVDMGLRGLVARVK